MTGNLGILYGIGVGPGDPELITLKAVRVLEQVPYVFAAASTKNDYSLALNIVRHHIKQGEVQPLSFPMTNDPQVLAASWENNARTVLAVLEQGHDAAFITIGDPLTYSTYGYLLKTVKKFNPDIEARTIPGITSYNAAAALANIPLTEGEESFYLISGARGGDRLQEALAACDNIVMLKTYRHFDKIYDTLEHLQLLDCTTCVVRCGLPEETVVHDVRSLKDQKMPYLSLLIIKKQGRGY
ncbi:MAG: precorrin-2 C(20)-methyltransferase [Desulfobacca sp.]|uniref:precorrin-2 C(20)-methyltransferase n=1 Tax=Desulfobacca sp. TaxID=2067990 RepID=UPI00404985C9